MKIYNNIFFLIHAWTNQPFWSQIWSFNRSLYWQRSLLQNSILVEVHQTPAQIPPCRQGDDEEEEEEGKRGEEKVRPVQDVKTAVPKESDVDVIA